MYRIVLRHQGYSGLISNIGLGSNFTGNFPSFLRRINLAFRASNCSPQLVQNSVPLSFQAPQEGHFICAIYRFFTKLQVYQGLLPQTITDSYHIIDILETVLRNAVFANCSSVGIKCLEFRNLHTKCYANSILPFFKTVF